MKPVRGIPFVVSAPSGTGKTTVCHKLLVRDAKLEFSISHTTRPARPDEQDGTHYYFVDRAAFHEILAEDGFVEHAEYAGNLYGTSKAAIDEPLARGRDLLLEVEVQGAMQLRAKRRDARFIFLLPPSHHELERRLRARGTDAETSVAARLDAVGVELDAVHHFDYVVVNEDLESTVGVLLEIIQAERSSRVEAVRGRFDPERVLAERRALLEAAEGAPGG